MNVAAGLVGVVFGAALFLTGMGDYDVIHDGLLFRSPHLYLMMVATLATGATLLWLLRRRQVRTVFGGPISVSREPVERKHLAGGVIFGTGWAIAGTCPGAVAAMAASGKPLALIVMAGVAIGVTLRDMQEARVAASPSTGRALTPPVGVATFVPVAALPALGTALPATGSRIAAVIGLVALGVGLWLWFSRRR